MSTTKTNASATGWNVYRWTTEEGRETELVGSAETLDEAHRVARRLGADQIQRGLDGEVVNVADA